MRNIGLSELLTCTMVTMMWSLRRQKYEGVTAEHWVKP